MVNNYPHEEENNIWSHVLTLQRVLKLSTMWLGSWINRLFRLPLTSAHCCLLWRTTENAVRTHQLCKGRGKISPISSAALISEIYQRRPPGWQDWKASPQEKYVLMGIYPPSGCRFIVETRGNLSIYWFCQIRLLYIMILPLGQHSPDTMCTYPFIALLSAWIKPLSEDFLKTILTHTGMSGTEVLFGHTKAFWQRHHPPGAVTWFPKW